MAPNSYSILDCLRSIASHAKKRVFVGMAFALVSLPLVVRAQAPTTLGQQDWPVAGGAPGNSQYSSLAQINRSNVKSLQVAWQFDTGESAGWLEHSPLVIDGVLYACTPSLKIFALDAATGKSLWRFDSGVRATQPNRGLSFWTDGKDKRLFAGIMNFLYELDAKTGKPVESFGQNGRVNLEENFGRPAEGQYVLTSPGAIYKDLIIVGGRSSETLPAPPGDIRAYDVRSGKIRWSFHTVPHPGEFGYETWPKEAWKYSGGANNWAGMALDAERGILYVPTAAGKSWFYGGLRLGDNLFGTSLIALNAATGERIWHFQIIKHDIWDWDLPAHPVLLTVTREGKKIDAVAQVTKHGFVFLFDRQTGKPLFPIEYPKVPASNVPGEVAANEQPFPLKPQPYARQRLTEDTLTNRTPAAHQWALDRFREVRSDGLFIPLSEGKKTFQFPSSDGSASWGSAAADLETGILYVNSSELAIAFWLEKAKRANGAESTKTDGQEIYLNQCASCHQKNLAGAPPTFPSLLGISHRLSRSQISETVQRGKGRMPGFPSMVEEQRDALIDFLTTGKSKEVQRSGPLAPPDQYRLGGFEKFFDPDGYPAIAPPWGTLNAIDLNTGEYVWKIPLGEYPELAAKGEKTTGTTNFGGPIVTAGGLVFIGATNFDKKFRAFDKATGKLLWETTLPFGGNATPSTYEVNGRQFIVIAAGGGRDGKPAGGVYVAFALPQ
jgi:quinoprotein glucose dehydrogenase